MNTDFELNFQDFVWTFGQTGDEIDFDSDKFTKKNGGKTIEVNYILSQFTEIYRTAIKNLK